MKQREFTNMVIDHIEASQEAIAGLQKQAEDAAAKPAFSDEVLEQTAEKLVESNLLSKEATDNLMQSFRDTPDEALLSLQKVVGKFAGRVSAPASLGHAVPIQKSASAKDTKVARSASDEAWETSFGDKANS